MQGLNHLQECGVCHRDLSLENILVDKENCLIIDMGMCLRVPYSDPKSRSRGTTDVAHGKIRRLMKPQGVCGKHNYMSPEIFENKENFDGFAIDLWATGVILYIMLTGFPPYDQASVTDQRFELIVTGKLVEQLHNWDIFVSDEAGDLMQRMLQMDPRDRPTLAQVMAHPWVARGEVQAFSFQAIFDTLREGRSQQLHGFVESVESVPRYRSSRGEPYLQDGATVAHQWIISIDWLL